jgi:hypothetical protein
MNIEQAKEILSLYRPGTADDEDPYFCEARQLCEQDPELKNWFNNHCAVYVALRAKLRQASVPDGLKEQILMERKVEKVSFRPKPVLLLAAAAVLVFAIGLAIFWFRPPGSSTMAAYENQMKGIAFRAYGMDLETSDIERVRAYLAQRQSPSELALPTGLKNARITGCVATSWKGKPVSMICFATGRQPGKTQISDLWLFVADNSSLPKSADPTPSIKTVDSVTSATWSQRGKTYLLIIEGEEKDIRKYL